MAKATAQTALADSAPKEVAVFDQKASDKVAKYIDELHDVAEELASVGAKKKGILDRAEKEGFNRRALVAAHKQAVNPRSQEERELTNRYLECYGDLPLFAVQLKH